MHCLTCRHQDRKSYAVPTCAHPKAYRPNGCQQACVVVLRRVPEPCPYHEAA